ncbi:nucleotide exchange factor GrpE [Sinomonas atrocyanea]|uniref:nucleotide exchange factor GrpE n=1 Tax=Sinomonas atrocyanea TaxID=37927 RepID=UPI00277E9606|nr:nucleotide exchange factor GrpE [Sinomonas atrocyanea]MDQ0259115.1 molecular chaperone GrpE [Sinomonas atrocyanea]MDR6622647.1 molecular chaperone GrpE [Sinomonas atrocyanea]
MAPHHGNENEHGSERPEPVIRDNRKVDPVTGEARHPEGAGAPEAAPHDDGHEEMRPVDEAHDSGDALAQAEQILNEAEAGEQEGHAAVVEELRNDLLRLQAEYVNYRRRVDRDRAVAGEAATMGVLSSLLPVLDDIDAARAHGDLEGGPFASIAGKLESIVASQGLERIDQAGVEFDPNIHEALIQQPGEGIEVDTVQQVLRTGYRTSARVLRAAQVIVATPQG